MQEHRLFSRRSKAESEKLSEKTQESFREESGMKMATGIQMVLEAKKNKLNDSSKWFTFGQKIRP